MTHTIDPMTLPENPPVALGRAETLTTARLVGHPLSPDDYANLRTIHGDPACRAAMEVPGYPMDEAYTRAFAQQSQAHWQAHGFGLRVFTLKRNGDFVGFGGLRRAEIAGRDVVSLGFAVRASYWRQGFATELVQAILAEGLTRIGCGRVVALTFHENLGSQRVLENAGLRRTAEIDHNGVRHLLYRSEGEADRWA